GGRGGGEGGVGGGGGGGLRGERPRGGAGAAARGAGRVWLAPLGVRRRPFAPRRHTRVPEGQQPHCGSARRGGRRVRLAEGHHNGDALLGAELAEVLPVAGQDAEGQVSERGRGRGGRRRLVGLVAGDCVGDALPVAQRLGGGLGRLRLGGVRQGRQRHRVNDPVALEVGALQAADAVGRLGRSTQLLARVGVP